MCLPSCWKTRANQNLALFCCQCQSCLNGGEIKYSRWHFVLTPWGPVIRKMGAQHPLLISHFPCVLRPDHHFPSPGERLGVQSSSLSPTGLRAAPQHQRARCLDSLHRELGSSHVSSSLRLGANSCPEGYGRAGCSSLSWAQATESRTCVVAFELALCQGQI